MAIDPAQLAANLSEIVSNLPSILQATQIVVYVFMVLFLGSIVIMGYRGFLPFWKKLLLRVAFGFLCLISAVSLGGFMPFLSQGIYTLFQADMLAAGILSSFVFALSLYFISLRVPRDKAIRKQMERLEKKLHKIEGKGQPSQRFRDYFMVIGVLIAVVFLLFALINFRGFPFFGDNIYSFFGFSQEDMENIGGMLDGIGGDFQGTEGCNEIMNVITQNPGLLSDPGVWETYINDGMQAEMESDMGTGMLGLQKAEYDGKVIILGVVNATSYCIATEDEVCYCRQ